MRNREKYDFDCFTLDNYKRHLDLALEQGFRFKGYFGDIDCGTVDLSLQPQPVFSNEKTILWRHDMEFSPYTALEMAKIEHSQGVKATYFCQTHAETYNLFERSISDLVLEIQSFGHNIGLHFNSHYWGIGNEVEVKGGCGQRNCSLTSDLNLLNACIQKDVRAFADNLGIVPRAFSFHCTDDFIKSCEDDYYGGLLNVYSKLFKAQFAYCTDSTGFWRYERLEERLRDPSITRLQVLTHDAMWSRSVLSPRKRVFAAIDERAQKTKEWYDQVLVDFGAKNVDDDEVEVKG